ncbi:ABC transporter substrate-binding protein [Frankia sp. CN6]|uniref:ABC transporter substrate-binding protein n=1 Tax=Frankia nepalensis TaxID=1836974 RepID=A0A937R8L5_9ACTN|nr:ABC transporter substrate-binding protein [Frankia nepalensis]
MRPETTGASAGPDSPTLVVPAARRRGRWRLGATGAALALALVPLAACGSDTTGAAGASGAGGAATDTRGCLTSFDPDTDYFPVKSTIEVATNVTITYHDSYQVVTVKEPYPDGKPESYVLVRCGAPTPELTGDLARAPRIEVPVTSLYSGSTTHLPQLADLGRLDALTGVADDSFVVNADVRQRVADGAVEVYAPGQQVNAEKIVVAQPDLLLTDGTELPAYRTVRDAGIPVVADADWLEASPLGRAEWLKVIAAFTGTEAKAADLFDRIQSDYAALAAKATATGVTPVKVLPGSMYEGTWYMPSGRSYVGQLLVDAGADYPWAEVVGTGTGLGTGSLELNFEAVFARAGDAPVWLADGEWSAVADAVAQDSRYGELAAVRSGQVWTNTLVMGPGGGSDYWERGVGRPDLVLADVIAILHPELAPGHAFAFYKKLPA